jgi:hypothetical protein
MNIIYLLIVILVPIIPAYLLFKKLKSSAEASGPVSPIKEFSVKFGGAFAGYFPIFFLLYFKLPNEFTQQTKSEEPWEIIGTIKDATTNKTIQKNSDAELQVVLQPFSRVKESGSFTLYLVSTKPIGKEILDYELQIEDKKGVYLSSDVIQLDEFRDQFKDTRKIKIPDSCLKLTKKPTGLVDSVSVSPPKEFQ